MYWKYKSHQTLLSVIHYKNSCKTCFLHFHVVILKVSDLNKIKRVRKVFKNHRRLFRWAYNTFGCCLNWQIVFSSEYIFTSYSTKKRS